MKGEGHHLIREVDEIRSSMKCIFTPLFQVKLLKLKYKQGDTKLSIDDCSEFKRILQDLIDRHIMQARNKVCLGPNH